MITPQHLGHFQKSDPGVRAELDEALALTDVSKKKADNSRAEDI
jgi:hypothetical protein